MQMRRLAPGLAVLAAVTIFVAGCGEKDGGDDSSASGTGNAGQVDSTPSSTATENAATMPDLTGLTEDEARVELGNLGVEDIAIEQRENLGSPGTVVDQVPGVGNPITGTITLVVATPVGPVPDFTGLQVAEVQAWADERGITFTEEAVPNAELPDGQVVATTPASGQTATSEIVVQVARTPQTLSLDLAEALESDDSYCYAESGQTSIDGEPFAASWVMPDGSECYFEFDLGRDWTQLTGLAGFTDDSDSDTRMRVQIILDGTEKLNQVIDFGGDPIDLNIDVTDGLRLRIALSDVQGYGTVGFGNLQLIGAPSDDSVGDESASPTSTG